MKIVKTKPVAASNPQLVWCYHCCIRIAPYDLRTVYHGRDYHRDCFAKLSHSNKLRKKEG